MSRSTKIPAELFGEITTHAETRLLAKETLALTAIPQVIRKAESGLHLQYVKLYATDGKKTQQWTLRNRRPDIDLFAGITDHVIADDTVTQLQLGQTVLIPGLFDKKLIKRVFGKPEIIYVSHGLAGRFI